jgi:hypothetical protein
MSYSGREKSNSKENWTHIKTSVKLVQKSAGAGEIGISKISYFSLMAIFPFPTYGLALVVKNNPRLLNHDVGVWKYYCS